MKDFEPEFSLRQLAVDIAEGRVFGTWNVPPGHDYLIPNIFMPLSLGAKLPDDTAHVYEYLDKSGELGINGYPMFSSCRVLTKSQSAELKTMVSELMERRKEFLNVGSES